jgi:SAM-dependent methyltransferase
LIEFTGERVIPGQVDVDLWNEHLARYAFAARFASRGRVVDAGCGTGYGSAELARSAGSVLGLDSSPEAVRYARDHYAARNLRFLTASCGALPLPDASVELVVALEVIEHLTEWQGFLAEARRVLAPAGQFIVSTPNKEYYAESRRLTGPNPYHVHEFDFAQFCAQLRSLFPHVTVFLQNHIQGIGIQPLPDSGSATELLAADSDAEPTEAHFFIALCSLQPQPPPSPFLYLPRTGNLLRERELHIGRLEAEVATKDRWLEDLRAEKQDLVDMFRAQTAELQRSNRWAQELDDQLHLARDRVVELQGEIERATGWAQELDIHLHAAQDRIVGLQQEIERATGWARDLDRQLHAAQDRIVELQQELEHLTAGYQAQVAELASENQVKTEWATGLNTQLEAKGQELLNCIRLLDEAENTVKERTAWAMRLDEEIKQLETQLSLVRASRWVRLGRRIGLGPELPQR